MNTIIENPNRHFYVFINDHHKYVLHKLFYYILNIYFHRDTYLAESEGELINDYNDRCIRKACSWYISHLPQEHFIFITDDVNNRKLAIEENIPSCSSSFLIYTIIQLIYFM